MSNRHGMSLLETMIAVAIFATLTTMTIQASQGASRILDADAPRDDLSLAGSSAIEAITEDLTSTAWFYNWNDLDGNGEVDTGETVTFYMPWVNPKWDASATATPLIAGEGVPNYTDGSPASAWPVPPAQLSPPIVPRGDRLLFVRLQGGNVASSVPIKNSQAVSFDDPDQAPVQMSRFMDGPPVAGLLLNTSVAPGSDINFVTQRWDSDRADNNWAQNRDKTRLRTFAYVLQRSPRTGMGRLVRLYRNAGTWNDPVRARDYTEDKELCDWVESVRFDTRRTQSTLLGPNQIRIRLVLRKDLKDGTGGTVSRRFETTIAMRSITYDD